MALFFVREGLRLHKQKPFDCIVTYSHMMPALCGVLLKWLTGARLIVQIATSPHLSILTNRAKPTIKDRVLRIYSDVNLQFTLLSAERAHILAPNLLEAYPRLRNVKTVVFHEFVAASSIALGNPSVSNIILFVGMPWYLKGVDILLNAFRRLEPEFPEARLQILGHNPDNSELRALAAGIKHVEFLKAQLQPKALETISNAAVLVLPSRCEGMGRVLLEAMHAAVPVVGSDVGGIPHIIRDGENGFLFPSENVEALEAILRRLLADPALRERLGKRGREMALEEFTEARYAKAFAEMVYASMGADPPTGGRSE